MGGVEQYSFYIIAWDDWPPRSRVYWEKIRARTGLTMWDAICASLFAKLPSWSLRRETFPEECVREKKKKKKAHGLHEHQSLRSSFAWTRQEVRSVPRARPHCYRRTNAQPNRMSEMDGRRGGGGDLQSSGWHGVSTDTFYGAGNHTSTHHHRFDHDGGDGWAVFPQICNLSV